MEPFVLAFIAIGLLVILVFIIYLVDRVNTIEKETRQFARSLQDTKEPPLAGAVCGFVVQKTLGCHDRSCARGHGPFGGGGGA